MSDTDLNKNKNFCLELFYEDWIVAFLKESGLHV